MADRKESTVSLPQPSLAREPDPIEVFENEGGKTFDVDTTQRYAGSLPRILAPPGNDSP